MIERVRFPVFVEIGARPDPSTELIFEVHENDGIMRVMLFENLELDSVVEKAFIQMIGKDRILEKAFPHKDFKYPGYILQPSIKRGKTA